MQAQRDELTYLAQEAVTLSLEILDELFRRCLGVCEALPKDLQGIYAGRQRRTQEIDWALTHARLQRTLGEVYDIIVEAVFRLVPILAPGAVGRPLNLYGWPAYRSLITRERVDYIRGDGRPSGLGIRGLPGEPRTWQKYSDCRQAAWHNLLFREVQFDSAGNWDMNQPRAVMPPPSIDAWLVGQRPRVTDQQFDVMHSLTLSAIADVNSVVIAEHRQRSPLLRLDGDSYSWGQEIADVLNSLLSNAERKDWVFPDRRDVTHEDEGKWRQVRCLLYSLWFHVSFRPDLPPWLPDMLEVLRATGLSAFASDLRSAADHESERPLKAQSAELAFSEATVISLHRLLSNAALTEGATQRVDDAGRVVVDIRSLGTVLLMSSRPLGQCVTEMVRPWIRSVFAMVRNSELTVFAERLIERESARARLGAAGFVIHELNAIFAKQFSNVREQLGSCDPDTVRTRRFTWDLIGSLLELASMRNRLILRDTIGLRAEVRRNLVNPLRKLLDDGNLDSAIRYVAVQVHRSARHKGGASISSLEDCQPVVLSPQQFGRCFLLVAEPIRNFCEHAEPDSSAEWTIEVKGGSLNITLRQSCRESLPNSGTFEMLGEFLNEIRLGTAPPPRWVRKHELMEWVVEINLYPPEDDSFNETATSQTAAY